MPENAASLSVLDSARLCLSNWVGWASPQKFNWTSKYQNRGNQVIHRNLTSRSQGWRRSISKHVQGENLHVLLPVYWTDCTCDKESWFTWRIRIIGKNKEPNSFRKLCKIGVYCHIKCSHIKFDSYWDIMQYDGTKSKYRDSEAIHK